MNFPAFWALGRDGDFACWRWSHESQAEAQAAADVAARQLSAQFSEGRPFGRAHDYYGTDRPMREPVLREFTNHSGNIEAVITRNSYGCLVLNTARMMFVDVDAPEPTPPRTGGWLQRLFGRPQPAARASTPLESQILELARSWVQAHAGWGWRVYRTKAGLRLLAIHALFAPDSPEVERVFNTFGADPLYRRLCRAQKCFRARLTPKPWRCDADRPPGRWPFQHQKAQLQYQRWEERYRAACQKWASCELIAKIGSDEVHPEIVPLLVTHDETSQVGSQLPLA